MRITDEMIAEDEKRWHARDILMELNYCSTYMRDRKDITNLDIRFYAYIMRKARDLLKAQDPINPERSGKGTYWYYCCGNCGQPLDPGDPFCRKCGRAVAWNV